MADIPAIYEHETCPICGASIEYPIYDIPNCQYQACEAFDAAMTKHVQENHNRKERRAWKATLRKVPNPFKNIGGEQ